VSLLTWIVAVGCIPATKKFDGDKVNFYFFRLNLLFILTNKKWLLDCNERTTVSS
jgi:hypothetical protein